MKKLTYFGDGDWIYNATPTSFERADIIVMPGGADWHPNLYGEEPNSHVNWLNPNGDSRQMNMIKAAIERKKFLFGICRGLQGLTIAAGGKLIQHVNHPGAHHAHTKDGRTYTTNSLHHQMCNPYGLPEDEYEVLSYAPGLSPFHLGELDTEVVFPAHAYDKEGNFMEPETIWFPKIRALGAQGHPEMCYKNDFVDLMNEYIQTYF